MNPLNARPPNMAEFNDSEIKKLMSRINNWRRHYRNIQRIHAVSYYSPPRLGEVLETEIIVRIPTSLDDAKELEAVWSQWDSNSAKKWYILWRYIKLHQQSQIRRMIKQYGERIRTNEEFDNFNKRSLESFWRRLNGN